MPWARYRQLLVLAAALDGLGLVGLTALINHIQNQSLDLGSSVVIKLLLVLVTIYCSFGWLFGSYTLLKLRRMGWRTSLSRLGTTSLASIVLAIVMSYTLRLQISTNLFFRSSLIPLFLLLAIWSALVRLCLRQLLRKPDHLLERWRIVALPNEMEQLKQAWNLGLTASIPIPTITSPGETGYKATNRTESVAISSGAIHCLDMQEFCQAAVNEGQQVKTLVDLAEQELQRIPSQWITDQWLVFSDRIDGIGFKPSKQLKRYGDVLISLFLITLASPILALTALIVKLEDGGPIIYSQTRTGVLGQTFQILKIRTMRTDAEKFGARWAEITDKRITKVGYWLRISRIDELPQLINVLRGEMSLIGPRPERPEMEKILEKQIPNYRLRHWMRPGLSGWAQVNMPYGSSIEDAELKLSYDLFYIRNAGFWLDLLIFAKTLKTVLKAAGR
jgi:lipopolysaccharide/colanic/teichoic acid biosynthesis glycosyltransferase/type III secretory pathway component EscS